MNSPSAIQTFTGVFFDPFDPDPSLIRIEDIAHSLSLQCRFTGHVKRHWSVAAHSILVSDLCSLEDRLCGLLHDATEAYVVDLPRPIKNHPLFLEYRMLEGIVWRAIATKFGLPVKIPPLVHAADNLVLWAEANALLHGTAAWADQRTAEISRIARPNDADIARVADIVNHTPNIWSEVELVFLSRFRVYS